MQIFIGFLLAIIIALIAWRAGSLSRSGAWAAVLTGGLIFGLGGLPWAALLLTFFISSSALSRAFSRRKATLAEKFSKGSQRDWGQVLANGGLGALLAIGYAIPPHYEWLWLAYAGAMAAVNADTWSTELGVLSPVPPRLITSGAKVERGTSGGISLSGTLAALAGATLVGIVAILFTPATAWISQSFGNHSCRFGRLIIRFNPGCNHSSHLLVPNLQQRDRKTPCAYMRQPNKPGAWLVLDQ